MNNSKMSASVIRNIIILGLVILISGIAHGFNMFQYPYYENDEGTYMSQAWSLLERGNPAPYTYTYDHAPVGWMLIALWVKLTGGFYTFGLSVNSGRVLMLVLHVLSSALLFSIARKISGSFIVAVISVLLFSLSPLAIYFQRRVLLDNISTFWLLLSLFTLLQFRPSIITFIISAITYAVSVLSKEVNIVFLPVMIYLGYFLSKKGLFEVTSLLEEKISDRRFPLDMIIWGITVFVVLLSYPLYAYLRGELFPFQDPVNLVDGVFMQLGANGGGILNFESGDFWVNLRGWIKEDPIIIIVGLLATIANFIIGLRRKPALILSLFTLSIWLFYMRGGRVLEFYIIPAIPFLALNISYALDYIAGTILGFRRFFYGAAVFMLILMVFAYSRSSKGQYNIYTANQTISQISAVNWMQKNITAGSQTVIDNYGYVDLNDYEPSLNRRYDYYFKVDFDPEIKDRVYGNSVENIDYVAVTPQMIRDITLVRGLSLTRSAIERSVSVANFFNDGWGVEILTTQQALSRN